MKARTATVGDLETVFQGLSNRMSHEYVSSGLGATGAQDRLTMNLREGRAHALLGEEDETLGIIAWDESDDIAHTLFAAQEDFFSASTVRFCRHHIRRIQQLTGNLPLQHRSWLNEDDVKRWFRILGFVEKADGTGFTLFELPAGKSRASDVTHGNGSLS